MSNELRMNSPLIAIPSASCLSPRHGFNSNAVQGITQCRSSPDHRHRICYHPNCRRLHRDHFGTRRRHCFRSSRSIQCEWQVTAKHALNWLHGVHRTCAETAAVSRGISHVSTKQRCNRFGYSNRAVLSDSHSFRVAYD